jgi:hypothetical protein
VRKLQFACVEEFTRVIQTSLEYLSGADLQLGAMHFTNAKSLSQLLLGQSMLGMYIKELRERLLLPEETAVPSSMA